MMLNGSENKLKLAVPRSSGFSREPQFIDLKLWQELCAQFNIPEDIEPKFIGAGCEQSAFLLGDQYVIKTAPTDSRAYRSTLKILNKDISFVAKCHKVIPTSGTNVAIISDYYSREALWKELDVFLDIANYSRNIGGGYEKPLGKKEMEMYKEVRKAGFSVLCDIGLHNVRKHANGHVAIIDYGCFI